MNEISRYLNFYSKKDNGFEGHKKDLWYDGDDRYWGKEKPNFWIYLKVDLINWFWEKGFCYLKDGEDRGSMKILEFIRRLHISRCRMDDFDTLVEYEKCLREKWSIPEKELMK